MSFHEWWGERVDPGQRGSIELSGQHEPCRCRPLVFLRFLFVAIALPVLWVLTVPLVPLPTWQAAALVVGGTMVYVALAYLVNPEPNLENLGWAGGLVDHPWRISDDWNRFLLSLQIVLGPGRFVAESLFDIGCLFQDDSQRDGSAPGSPDGIT